MQSQEGELCGTCMTGTLQHQHGALVCDQCGTMSQVGPASSSLQALTAHTALNRPVGLQLFREERRDEEDDAAPPPGQVRRIYQKKERRARQRRSEAPKQLPMEERIFKYAQLLQVLLQVSTLKDGLQPASCTCEPGLRAEAGGDPAGPPAGRRGAVLNLPAAVAQGRGQLRHL